MKVCVVGAGAIGGLLGAVIELADMTGVDAPALKAVYACAGLQSHTISREQIAIAGCAAGG